MMKALLLPVFAQIVLTFCLAVALARSRMAAVTQRRVAMKDVALGQHEPWPQRTQQIGRAYQNQFETPVLFYTLVALAIATDRIDAALVAGAWAFVAAHFAHAWIHVTSNRVPRRFQAFLASGVVLGLMWIEFALRSLVV